MEFGKLQNVDLVNWTLPEDDPLAKSFLNTKSNNTDLQIYFGAPAWGHKEWIGRIYPSKSKATDFLFHYAKKFSCIELNTSHYRIPSADQVDKWLGQVSGNFLFCPKVYQSISHSKEGLIDRELLKLWFTFLESLGSHCGPSFLQLPPYFDYSQKALLFKFLQLWPDHFPLALEFRHSSWFNNGKILPALTQYLQSRHIGLVITDVAGRRDVLHTSISSDYTMLRFIGNELHKSDYFRAEMWARRFEQWKIDGLKKIFLFIHEPDDILVPEMTEFFTQKLNEICGTHLEFEQNLQDPTFTL